jgi:hypothetical protein
MKSARFSSTNSAPAVLHRFLFRSRDQPELQCAKGCRAPTGHVARGREFESRRPDQLKKARQLSAAGPFAMQSSRSPPNAEPGFVGLEKRRRGIICCAMQILLSKGRGSRMKRFWFGALLVVLTPLVWALPTVQDVDAEVQKGHYAQAESMMQEVVAAKPQSARAHYVYAQILAHNGRFSVAAAEEARARHLDPAMKFSKAEDVRAFEQRLEKERRRTPSDGTALGSVGPTTAAVPGTALAPVPTRQVAPPLAESNSSPSGLPGWVWPVAIIALVFVAWRMMRSSGRVPSPAAASAPPYAAASYGPGGAYPPGTAGPGMAPAPGAGLMGVGLAAAGGVAAGMLAERLLERGREQRGGDAFYDGSGAGSSQPDPDARALEDRSIDFGSGSDWSDGGGSSDIGGGSDDASW